MFQRYLEGGQAQAVMLPSSYVASPISTWYMKSGIHLLNDGADPDTDESAEADISADVNSSAVRQGLLASTVTSHKVQEWMDAVVHSAGSETSPESNSSDDNESNTSDVHAGTADTDEKCSVERASKQQRADSPSNLDSESTEGKAAEEQRVTMRELAMSPSNLRPMSTDYEATKAKEQPAAVDDATAQAEIEEQLLAMRVEKMCSISGERPEDVQAMYIHKLQMCPIVTPHDWIKCPYAHDGEVARRRDPAIHSANPCSEYERTQACTRGDKCRFSHGVWERGLHPQRYRTSLCSKGEKCDRRICFFAHTPDQVRKPTNGRGYHNEAIASVTITNGTAAESGKLSRRKARALARKLGIENAANVPACTTASSGKKSSLLPALSSLPLQSKPGQAKAKITVDVESKSAHGSATVEEGMESVEGVSPGSNASSGGANSVTSSSQASTVQTMTWADDNFAEVIGLASSSPQWKTSGSKRWPDGGTTRVRGDGHQDLSIVDEGSSVTSVDVNHEVGSQTSSAKGGVQEVGTASVSKLLSMWSAPESAALPAPDSGAVSLGLLQHNTGGNKVHTKKNNTEPVLRTASGAVQDWAVESTLINQILAIGPLPPEGCKSEWLIEPDAKADMLVHSAAPAFAAVSSRSVFGESIGPKSEWLKGDDLDLPPRRDDTTVHVRARSASPSKMRRGASPDRLPFGTEWVEQLVDDEDKMQTAAEDDDSIQKWGEWMLSTAQSTLAHSISSSPALRVAAQRGSAMPKTGNSSSKAPSWLLSEATARSDSSWLYAEESPAKTGGKQAVASSSSWLLHSPDVEWASRVANASRGNTDRAAKTVGSGPRAALLERAATGTPSKGSFSVASGSAFSAVSSKSLASGAEDFVRNSLFGSPGSEQS